ncbi:MAG: hypothetical protein NW237_06400 [Cyanobacteriota bacterium]|nr:hypothetical protein [Cyanobacteriota bacterium]
MIVVVCLVNALLFLALLWALPAIWGVREALRITAGLMTEWAEAAEAALHPAPAALGQLRQSLRQSRARLTEWQQRLKLWRGLMGVGRWVWQQWIGSAAR